MKSRFAVFFVSCLFAGRLLASELGLVTAEQLTAMQQNDNALVVDVRTPGEWQSTGIISDSQKLQAFDTNGNFDQEKWLASLEKLKSSTDQTVILVCRSGNRSGKVGRMLTEQLGMKNVYHLSNGIQQWIEDGHPVAADCPATTCK